MRIPMISSAILLLGSFSASAQAQPATNVMPAPQSVQLKSGQLLIDRSFSVAVTGFRDPMLERGVQRFVGELSRETGIPFFPKSAPGPRATLAVHAESGIGKVQK
ncbi:MAG: beta-N-acetylhexosaminidase, partial [Terriglobales bacterium]